MLFQHKAHIEFAGKSADEGIRAKNSWRDSVFVWFSLLHRDSWIFFKFILAIDKSFKRDFSHVFKSAIRIHQKSIRELRLQIDKTSTGFQPPQHEICLFLSWSRRKTQKRSSLSKQAVGAWRIEVHFEIAVKSVRMSAFSKVFIELACGLIIPLQCSNKLFTITLIKQACMYSHSLSCHLLKNL